MAARDVFPGVDECILGVIDFDVGMLSGVVVGSYGHQTRTIVDFIIGFVATNLHFNSRSLGASGIDLHDALVPQNINPRPGVFPSELFSVVKFEVPLVGVDVDFKGFFLVWVPNRCVGPERKNGEPHHKDGGHDVEHGLKPRIVPIDGEGAHFDMIDICRVRFYAFAIAQNSSNEPTECEYCY